MNWLAGAPSAMLTTAVMPRWGIENTKKRRFESTFFDKNRKIQATIIANYLKTCLLQNTSHIKIVLPIVQILHKTALSMVQFLRFFAKIVG